MRGPPNQPGKCVPEEPSNPRRTPQRAQGSRAGSCTRDRAKAIAQYQRRPSGLFLHRFGGKTKTTRRVSEPPCTLTFVCTPFLREPLGSVLRHELRTCCFLAPVCHRTELLRLGSPALYTSRRVRNGSLNYHFSESQDSCNRHAS